MRCDGMLQIKSLSIEPTIVDRLEFTSKPRRLNPEDKRLDRKHLNARLKQVRDAPMRRPDRTCASGSASA